MSAITDNSHASVVWWKDLDRWVNPRTTLVFRNLPKGWSVVKVGEVVRQFRETCEVGPDSDYRMIGVKWYGEGTFHRETVHGSKISARNLCPVMPGAFIYNRLFAWKASFAVVPQEYKGYFVSNEFPQFAVDSKHLLAEFLYLYFSTSKVIQAVVAASVGSAAVSRNRFKEEEFLAFLLPLPPLAVQEQIVSHWREAREAVTKSRETVAKLESDNLSQFFTFLGLKPPKMGEVPKAFAVSWKDFSRWSVSYNQATLDSADLSRGKYPVMDLGRLLSYVQYGTSEKANSSRKGTPIIRMNNIRNGLLDLADLKHIELNSNERDRLLLQDGDILFNRTNSKELVGKCAVFHEAGEYIFASYLIRVRVRPERALPDYIAFFLNSPFGRQQINALSRHIIGQANINTEELRSLQISVPPLEVQREIVDMVNRQRQRADEESRVAEDWRTRATREVEEMILGTRPVK